MPVEFYFCFFIFTQVFQNYFNIVTHRKMKKYKIERTQFTNDITITNMNRKLITIQSPVGQQLLNSVEDSLQEKKTEKIIKPARKRQVVVNFQKNDTITDDQQIRQSQNDVSGQHLKLNTSRNETLQKTKSFAEENKIKALFNNYRFENIKKHLISQTRKNSIYREPVFYEPFNQDTNQDHLWKGVQIQRMILNIGYFIGIAHTFIACLLTTLFIAFQEKFLQDSSFLQFQIISFILLTSQIIIGFVRVKDVGSRKLNKLRDIATNYLRSLFIIDTACLLSVIICLISSNNNLNFLLATFFLKIPECVEKLVKVETKLFDSFYLQQYWGLMKILCSNFLYAHFLAILLLMMSWLDEGGSWLHKEDILNAPWYQQYSWAYYWGTTIMLTVGFGDLSAANYKQAICLVLIETVSCMAFAYNINCIGNLIKELRSGQIEKQKNLKILKKLCDKNQINSDLGFKLTNHVKESYNIETKYNFEEESQFLFNLPINLREDFLRAANYKVLENLTFIKNFTHKTILALAQKLEMKISHPNEVILASSDISRLVILKQGEIGLFPIHINQKYNKIIIDKFIVKENQPSRLISLDFLQLPFEKKYQIKSTTYSQIFQMKTQDMLSVLKRKNSDLQFFYAMKDKEKINFDSFQLIKCSNCKCNHTKFRCPRLHYMPICQQVVFRHLHKIKVSKNVRMAFKRVKNPLQALFSYKRNYQIGSRQKFLSICEIEMFQSADYINQNEIKNTIQKRIGIYSTANLLNETSSYQIEQKRESANKIPQRKQVNLKKSGKQQDLESLSAAHLMQKQVIDILNQKSNEINFWSVELDEAKDYKFYFNKSNPQCLQNLQLKKATPMRSKSMVQSRANKGGRRNA